MTSSDTTDQPRVLRGDTIGPSPAAVGEATFPWAMLAVLVTGQFMSMVDATIVNVAMPTIRAELHPSAAGLELVVAGYTIAYAMLLVTGARLGDIVGSRRVFVLGMWLFVAASLACGLAPTAGLLIAARFVQGAGAAAMVPQILSVIQHRFAGAQRARAVGIYGATLALGAVTGQVLGGVLVQADLFGSGWRPVFLVNVPVGIAVAVLAPRLVPESEVTGRRRVDVPGLLAATSGVLLVVLPLVLGREEGWPAWTWASLVLGVLVLAGFVLIERRVTQRGGDPLLQTTVLRSRGLRSALVAEASGMVAYGGFLFAVALHLQVGLGHGPLAAGLTFAPAAATFGAVGYSWRRLRVSWQRFLAPAGFALSSSGYLALAFELREGRDVGAVVLATLAVTGVGMGAAFSPVLAQSLVHVPVQRAADASGLLSTVIQLAQVVGVTILGSVYFAGVERPGPAASGQAISTVLEIAAAIGVLGLVPSVFLSRAAHSRPTA